MKSRSLVNTMNVTKVAALLLLVLMFVNNHSVLAAPAKRHKRTPASESTLSQALSNNNHQLAVDNLLDSLLAYIANSGDLANDDFMSKRSPSDTIMTELMSDLGQSAARDAAVQFLLDRAAAGGDFKRNGDSKRTASSTIKDEYLSNRNRQKFVEALRKQLLEGNIPGASKRSVSDTMADTIQKQIFHHQQTNAFLDQLLAAISEGGDIGASRIASSAQDPGKNNDEGSGSATE